MNSLNYIGERRNNARMRCVYQTKSVKLKKIIIGKLENTFKIVLHPQLRYLTLLTLFSCDMWIDCSKEINQSIIIIHLPVFFNVTAESFHKLRFHAKNIFLEINISFNQLIVLNITYIWKYNHNTSIDH